MSSNKKLSGIMLALAVSCFAMFIFYGLYFNTFGVDSSATMAFFNISESKQGLIMTVQAIGSFIMTIILGLFGEKINKLYGLSFGCALMALAAIAIGLIPACVSQGTGYPIILIYGIVGGIGYIIIDLLMNGAIADVFPDSKQTLLPFVHAFFGTGSMLAPILASLTVNLDNPSTFARPFLIIGICAFLVCIVFTILSRKAVPFTMYADMTEIRKRVSENPAEIFKEKRAWFYVLACFLHVAFQNSLSLWITNYCQTELSLSYTNAAMMLTMFFIGNLSMRFMCPVFYKIFSARKFYTLFISIAFVIYIVFILVPVPLVVRYILIVLLGFVQGGGVPTLIIISCEAFPKRSASASSLFVFGVCISSLIMPTLTGSLIESFGFKLPMIMIGILLILSVFVLGAARKYETD